MGQQTYGSYGRGQRARDSCRKKAWQDVLFVGLLAIAEWWTTIYTDLFFFVIAFPSIFEQGMLQIEIARATNGGYPSKEDNLLWLTWPKYWAPHEKISSKYPVPPFEINFS